MPINVDPALPAAQILSAEGIFVMSSEQAVRQDIRPLKIAILNIMPIKVQTETQLLRLLGSTPLQVEITLLRTATHTPKNTSMAHLDAFYKVFSEVANETFDGLIITGAPVEQMPFEQVAYWRELEEIMDWSRTNVYSTMHICWGAQAGLYYHYGIDKYPLEEKLSGVFRHVCADASVPLVRGFDSTFYVPHSRYTGVRGEDIKKVPELILISESMEAGPYLISDQEGRRVFVTGHPEYDQNTLRDEYVRDISRGLHVKIPQHYFNNNNPQSHVDMKWRAHSNLLFANWLNYYVYQQTPYDFAELKPHTDCARTILRG